MGYTHPVDLSDWIYIWMLRLTAIPFLLLGTGWIYRFGFTDYRAHLKPIGIPLGCLLLLIGSLLIKASFKAKRDS
jgi:hypothetical protein